MMRPLAAALALASLLPVTGCVSWQDKANAEALTACEKKADAAERRLCRETVLAAAEAERRKQDDAQAQQMRESEERELLNKVYGDPS